MSIPVSELGMFHSERVDRYLRYYYETGVQCGTYLEDVPFKNLDGNHRSELREYAEQAAKTGLLPFRYVTEDGDYQWIFEERRTV